jgi:hypothetical protein
LRDFKKFCGGGGGFDNNSKNDSNMTDGELKKFDKFD